ncbi:DUF4238 domain-containing protein [Acidicapsa dinghuensis]|uniref:DUF4238 domain-containing protein n=1 Tax=Acidicapsa dinghuensis TaxID=2218256 RepID=A0ABW1EFZ7_9BACT|nr:DUF4238 domain-containing protein [Acidicapsa dinghuensis]
MGIQHPNDTANQHYVSQVEQRLNSLNPNAAPENQRIYCHTLVDRETFAISLDSAKGRLISKTLALRDLFSFDVIPTGALRLNFETLFQQYEANMETNTSSLLRKLDGGSTDLKREILEIFVAKFMNFLRNPFSVEKVLNTVGDLLRFEPTDPDLLAQYKAVLTGRKPHQAHLCAQLGIDPERYRMWLAALFMMMLQPIPGGPNFMESTVKAVFERPSGFPMVCVYRYGGEHADKRCLLSDRGFSNPLPQEPHLSFSFNLTSTAFIIYLFAAIHELNLPFKPPPGVLELYRTRQKQVRVIPFTNDLAALARYNQNVVYQCHHAVYSSSQSVYGVQVK